MLSKMVCGCAQSPSPELIPSAVGTGWQNRAIDIGKDEVTFVSIDEFVLHTKTNAPLLILWFVFKKGFPVSQAAL